MSGNGNNQSMVSGIRPSDFTDELSSNFLAYAASVIQDRAIPDVRDGLKPVHRRIMWGMWEGGYRHHTPYSKSARITGHIMGLYHPHGDTSIYDALVRLAQPFSLAHPLVDGKGNFGNVDGDSAAAMRYTEARLSAFAEAVLFADIDENTVDFIPNYDGKEKEPVVLPARIPLLLLTSANGIAVGMATRILPFNLGEICDALVAVVRQPAIEVEELHKILTAPDFPLGGIVANVKPSLYRLGDSSIDYRVRASFEERSGKKYVVITDVPFQQSKSELIQKVGLLVREDKLVGIRDIRDESNKNGIRIVCEVDPRSSNDAVLAALYGSTDFQTSLSSNMVAILKQKPRMVGLLRVLKEFVGFRREIITKRTQNQKKRFEERKEIIDGIELAIKHKNEVIKLVSDSNEPVKDLMKLGLNQRQAEYVFEMPLRRFSKSDVTKLHEEQQQLTKAIADAQALLSSPQAVDEVIIRETLEIKDKFAIPRRTLVVPNFSAISLKDMVKKEDVVLIFLNDGTAKSTPISDYRLQRRRGRGSGTGARSNEDGAYPVYVATVNTHDDVMLITDKGNRYRINAFTIPPLQRGSKASPLTSVVQGFADDEKVVAVVSSGLADDEVLVIVGSNGMLKKQSRQNVIGARDSTKLIYDVARGGAVVGAIVAKTTDEIVLASIKGQVLRTKLEKIREVQSRNSAGVQAFRMDKGDRILSISRGDPAGSVLTVTSRAFAKRTAMEEYPVKPRQSPGVIGCKRKDDQDEVVFAQAIPAQLITDEDAGLFVMTSSNRVIRLRISDVRVTAGRSALGTPLKKLEGAEKVTSVTAE